MDDNLSDDTTLEIVVILITCIIKDDGESWLQIYLHEA